MNRRLVMGTALLFALSLAIAPYRVAALDPVVVAGADLGVSSFSGATGESTTLTATPRLSVNWRESLGSLGYLALDGRGLVEVPFVTAGAISDSERLSGELGIWVGEDEIVLGAGLDASFIVRGVNRLLLVPAWSADYRFANEAGWFAFQTDGAFRYDDASTSDRFSQRAGVGVSYADSIRLQFAGDLLGGYELWPQYAMVDSSGTAVDEDRSDLTLQASGELGGLVGYFTSWQFSALVLGRRSNAARLASGSFEADAESGVTARLGSTIRTTPTRTLGLSGSLSASHRWYAGRPTRDESGAVVASSLGVTSLDVGSEVDVSLLENLYLVGSLAASVDLAADPAYRSWSAQARVGAEYSF